MGSKNSRMEEVRKALGMSKAEFAAAMGVTPTYYSNILGEKGASNLRLEHLENLLSKHGVNPLWILAGKGDQFVEGLKSNPTQEAPDEEQVEALFSLIMEMEDLKPGFSGLYLTKFVCAQALVEFSDAQNLRELAFAARAYFRVCMRLPEADFTEILGVENPFGEGQN